MHLDIHRLPACLPACVYNTNDYNNNNKPYVILELLKFTTTPYPKHIIFILYSCAYILVSLSREI